MNDTSLLHDNYVYKIYLVCRYFFCVFCMQQRKDFYDEIL